ncbi:MAG: hypothetical protein WD850_03385 [Candidatus Spechtbacterales bacterium]
MTTEGPGTDPQEQPLDELFASHGGRWEEMTAHLQAAYEQSTQVDSLWRQIAWRLENGEQPDNPVSSLLTYHGITDPEIAQSAHRRYTDLQGELKHHQGEPILVLQMNAQGNPVELWMGVPDPTKPLTIELPWELGLPAFAFNAPMHAFLTVDELGVGGLDFFGAFAWEQSVDKWPSRIIGIANRKDRPFPSEAKDPILGITSVMIRGGKVTPRRHCSDDEQLLSRYRNIYPPYVSLHAANEATFEVHVGDKAVVRWFLEEAPTRTKAHPMRMEEGVAEATVDEIFQQLLRSLAGIIGYEGLKLPDPPERVTAQQRGTEYQLLEDLRRWGQLIAELAFVSDPTNLWYSPRGENPIDLAAAANRERCQAAITQNIELVKTVVRETLQRARLLGMEGDPLVQQAAKRLEQSKAG